MKFQFGAKLQINRLLVIVAMDVEEKAILKSLKSYEEITLSGTLNIQAKLFRKNGKELILVNSGIGLVNAGVTTALAAEKYPLDGVLLLGVAGAVKQDLEIGQLIVASKIIQHDSRFSGEHGEELMAPGAPYVSIPAEERQSPVFETDRAFGAWIHTALLSLPKIRYSEGTILSGSEFVGSAPRKLQLQRIAPDALAVEMEAAGIAVVAKKLKLPFAVLKTVADRLNPGSISLDYNRFIHGAAENAGEVVDLIWRSWTHQS